MLRKKEDKKFEKFFELVEIEAGKRNCEFFLDCGQGDVFENDTFICENMCGWLIPKSMTSEFVPLFMSDSDKQHEFDDFYVYIDYKVNGNNVEIEIDDSPDDFIVEFNIKDEIMRK